MGLDSIVGNFAQHDAYKSQATVERANARMARAQGVAARGRAYGQAARAERANEVAGQQAVMNMERTRQNATLARGQVQAVRGASGFTSEGSGAVAEVSVLERYEQAVRDMAMSRSLQDMETRYNAGMSRKSGDLAEMGAEADFNYGMARATQQEQLAKNAKHAGIAQIAGLVAGGALGWLQGSGVLSGAMRGGGLVSMTQSYTAGTYENKHDTVFGSVAEPYVADKISGYLDKWLS